MLALAFAEKTLSGLVFSALVVGIATYFGQAFIFDPIVLLAIIAIAFFFRRNIDILSICGVLIFIKGLEELMWRFLENTIAFKIPSYLILFICCLFLGRGLLRVYALSFLSLAVFSELWWYFTEYKAPYILWHCYMATVCVFVLRFMKMRTFWLIEINPKWETRPIFLDNQIMLVQKLFLILYSLVTFEYYLRHLLGFKDILIIYKLFPYIGSSLAIYTLYMIILQSVMHLKNIELNA